MQATQCSVDGCEMHPKPGGHKMCSKHIARKSRASKPRQRWYPDRDLSLPDRIRSHVEITDAGCWAWQGTINNRGYGVVGYEGKNHYVHRVMYADANGPIPKDRQLDHLCRNTRCCNPEHLEAVTARENMRRGMSPSVLLANANKCKAGHDMTDAYARPDGKGRQCRKCHSQRQAERNRRLRAEGRK